MQIEKYQSKFKPQLQRIFWETSSVDASSLKDPEQFQYKYLDYYLESYPEYCLLAKEEEKILGYICAVPNCQDEKWLHENIEYFKLFDSEYSAYPAELHINCSPMAQGRGVGSFLIEALVELLKEKNIAGVHLKTSQGARNVSFYSKNGFQNIAVHSWNKSELVLLGKKF